jgi:hypothetical protein
MDGQPFAAEIQVATQLLTTLFEPDDVILLRPVETWEEGGTKESRTIFRETVYRPADAELLGWALKRLLEVSAREHANLFFGVCPRFGFEEYDLAWQIRKANSLWADLDHTTVDEALTRIQIAGLPEPSIIVNSGNGVHLYWLLDQPYRIDDVGPPPAIKKRWETGKNGKKKPISFFVDEHGDVIQIKKHRQLVPKLSAQAKLFESIVAGLAAKIGGDHTHDLARLLRIPGSMNRKNGRNGAEPRPTTLNKCNGSLRYSLEIFKPLAVQTADQQEQDELQQVPLPEVKKKISAGAKRSLDEAILRSRLAKQGARSEADFAVCCEAISRGVDKEALWQLVQNVGKFQEAGREYFDRTWDKAATKVRGDLRDRALAKPPSAEVDGDVVTIAPSTPVRQTMQQITTRLLATGNCYQRVGQTVLIEAEEIEPLLTASELAGQMNALCEFLYIEQRGVAYRPLSTSLANTWLNQPAQRKQIPIISVFTRSPVYTEDWRLVASGYDAASKIYYAGEPIEPRMTTEHLDRLLKEFCFRSPADRTNYIGILLTIFLVSRFIGSKPALLLNGNQPNLGKSMLAQLISILRDGRATETATYNPNDEEFEKRLGALVRDGVTTLIIDNAKAKGPRSSLIESACLERSITDSILSYRLLGTSSTIRAENSHIFVITANAPEVSTDLVSRSVVVNMYYEGDPRKRSFTIENPEDYALEHRREILGELMGMVERWRSAGSPRVKTHTRFNKREWGNIIGGILAACGEPDFLADADQVASDLDNTRQDFAALVERMVIHTAKFWTSNQLVELARTNSLLLSDLGDGSPRSQSTRMGLVCGRYVGETFRMPGGSEVTFRTRECRDGRLYHVEFA